MQTYTSKSGSTFIRNFVIMVTSIVATLLSLSTKAQLTGTKNIPGDYATLAAAIADLNAQGVGSGGVILNLVAGNPETAPAGGFVIGDAGSAVLTTSGAANPVIIEGNGNTITAFSPQVSGSVTDAIFKIIGADYVTIQGFSLQENAANVTNTLASNDKTEFGVALFYVTTTDGAQNNTIQNNTISLSASYQNAIGIYSSTAHSATAPTTAAIASANSGSNNNTKVYGNTISNVANGIALIAGPVAAVIESGADVGGTLPGTGNNITFGNNTAIDAAWAGFLVTEAGIQLRNVIAINVQYNTVVSGSMTQAVGGILVTPSVVPISAAVAYTNTISNNNITLTETGTAAITGVQQGYGNSTATHVISSNIINLTQSVSAAAASQVNGVLAQAAVQSSTINNNNITINQSTSAGANSGQVNGIQNLPGASVLNSTQTITGNTVVIKQAVSGTGSFTGTMLYVWANFATNAFTISNANISANNFLTTGGTLRTSGTIYGVYHDYTYSNGMTLNNNTFNIDKTGTGSVNVFFSGTSGGSSLINVTNNNINITGTATAGQVIIVRENDGIGGNATQKNVNNNIINVNLPSDATTCFAFLSDFAGGSFSNNQITFNTAGSIQLTNLAANSATFGATGGSFAINNNTISLTSSLVSGVLNGLICATPFEGSYTVNNNTFTTLNLTAAGTSAPGITCISIGGGVSNTISGNKIQGSSTGAGTGSATLTGISLAAGTTNNVFKNKIYNLATSATGTATLIRGISATGGTTNNIYNNTIGFASSFTGVNSLDAIRGISITSTTVTSMANVYDNTVYVNSSSTGANFGTTGIFHTASATATTARLDLRNNIVINLSTPSGTGITSVLRRSAVATYGNYAATSDRNLLFAGTPGATRVILNDNGTAVSTLANFQAALVNRDQNSFTDEGFAYATAGSFFSSLTGSATDYLHIQPAIASRVEGGGLPVNAPLITDDYDGDPRNASTPDIGADEFVGVNLYPSITNVTVPTGACAVTSHTINADITVSTGTISTVTLNYNNGTAGSVAMTLSSGNTYSAVIPAGTPGALVTWSIKAVSSGGTSTSFNGTSYKDDPLAGLAVTATASVNPVCAGSPTDLTASVASFTSGQVGSGTQENFSNTNIGAFYATRFGNARAQILIRASELNAMGIYAGNITGLKVNVTGGTLTSCKGLTISLASTAATSLTSTFINTGLTQVYTIANYNVLSGVNTHTFSTAFTWDGISNLLVDYCFGNLVAGTTSPSNTYTATAFISGCYYGDNTANSACGTSATGTSSTIRPNISFDYAPAASSVSWSDGVSAVGSTNPLTVNPTTNTTYTASFTALNCPAVTNPLIVNVNALPSAPGANGSTQCGTGIPAAFVTTAGGGGGFRWYLTPTGGTAIPGETGASLATYSISVTTDFWVSEIDINTGCESPRSQVVATVNIPDAIQASVDNNSVCLNSQIQLSATNIASSPTNTYTYSWTASPLSGSGLAGSTAGDPLLVTPTAAGNYTYTVTGVDGSCTTTSTVVVTVKGLPVITGANATPSVICEGSNTTLTATTNIIVDGTGDVGEQSTTLGGVVGNPYRAGNGVGNQVRTQLLVTANDLATAGILPGNITSLGFTTTGIGGTMNNFTIKMAATNVGALTATFESPAFTTVFTQASFNAVVGLNTHVFQTPFNWNGTSNVVIDICQTNAVLGTTTVAAYTPSYLSNVQLAGSTTSCSGTTGTTVTTKPIMQFGGSKNGTGAGTYNWQWNPGAVNGNSVLVSPVNTTTYTVTATDPVTTCSSTQTVTVTVNTLPSAPSTSSSEQCGSQIPDASVSSNTGAPSPVFVWYTVPTGGTPAQSSTSTTFTNPVSTTTTFYVAELGSNGCESIRSELTVTVTPPDPIVAHANLTSVCQNSTIDLSVTQDLSNNNYDLTWSASPSAGSGIPSPVTGSLSSTLTITPTAGGTYTYTITGFDIDRGCSITSSIVVTVHANPSNVTANASSLNVCTGSTVNLTSTAESNVGHDFTPYTTGFEGTFPPSNWTIINAGTGNNWISNSNFTTPPPAHTGSNAMAYGYNATQSANTWAITPGQPFIAGDTYTISFWYNTQSFGGAYPEKLKVTIGTGATVSAQNAGTVLFNNGNLINETYAFFSTTFTATSTGTYYVGFNCYSNADENVLLIDDVSITGPTIEVPTFTWTSVPVGFTSNVQNPSNVVVNQTTTYTVVAGNSFGCVSDPVSVTVTALPLPNAPVGTNSAQCGVGVPTASVSTGGANGTFNWYDAQTGGTLLQTGGSSYTSAISTTTHFWVSESDGTCESLRTEVIVSVTQPDPIDATANVSVICLNAGNIQLSVTNTAPAPSNDYVYTWTATPSSGSGIPTSQSGATVNITATAAGTYTYTATAFDASGPGGGCTTTDAVIVTVNPVPVNLTAQSSASSVCGTGTVNLSATVVEPAVYINEGFSTAVPAGWAQQNLSSPVGTSPTWTQGVSAANGLFDAHSGAVNSYALANFNNLSGAAGTISNWLFTPTVTLHNGDVLSFWTRTVDAPAFPDRLEVRMSTNGSSVNVGATNTSVGDFTTILVTVNPTLTTSGYPNTWTQFTATISGLPGDVSGRFAFRYFVTNAGPNGANSDNIGIDDVSFSSAPYTYSWTSSPAGFTSSVQNPGAVTVSQTTTYSVTATNIFGCSSTSSVTVTYNDRPTGLISGGSTYCSTASATDLSIAVTGSGPWSGTLSDGTTFSGSVSPIVVTVTPSSTTTYTIATLTDNGTGCSATGGDLSGSATITINPSPAVPTISIVQPTCLVATGSINVTNPVGAGLSYSITGPSGTYQSSPSFGGLVAGSYTIHVQNSFGCITASAPVTINPQPVTPASPVVTGIVNVCPLIGTGTPVTYHAEANGATGFTWTIPPTNVTIVSGQGTADLTLTFSNGFATQANKQLRVTANSVCGTSNLVIYYLVAQLPNTPNPISGPVDACPFIGGTTQATYVINKVAGASSYLWSAQAGTTTISHPNGFGANDTTITVLFSSGFSTSAITVQAVNDCGTSGLRSITVTRNAPSTPSPISGPTNVCEFIAPGGNAATYSVNPTAGVTYTWAVPAGAINLTGQNTNSISFTYPVGFTSGVVSVQASTGCGVSSIRSLAVTKLNPGTPSNIDIIQTHFCGEEGGRVFTYSIAAMPLNATSILWTVPTGQGAVLLSGQGTTSITVSYPDAAINGSVTAQAVNNCGSSTIRSASVKLPACPVQGFAGNKTGNNNSNAKGATTVIPENELMTVTVFPNPTIGDFKLLVKAGSNQMVQVRVFDSQGKLYRNFTTTANQAISLGSEYKAGTYLVEARMGTLTRTTRVVKL